MSEKRTELSAEIEETRKKIDEYERLIAAAEAALDAAIGELEEMLTEACEGETV